MARPRFKRLFLLLLALSVVLPFTPSIFSLIIFFWPLLVSTVLAVLAVVSFGQQGGISIGQEEEAAAVGASENHAARPDVAALYDANTEKISDVLMVGNQEVTWLEWLHNEDMEKCLAGEHQPDCVQVSWDMDDLDVARNEASVGSLASSLEEKRIVDACDSVAMNENFTGKQVEKAADTSEFSLTDDTRMTAQADEKMLLPGQNSPASVVSKVDALMMETEALVNDGMASHMQEKDAKERDFGEDNGSPICKGDTEVRHSKENNDGPVWDVSGDEEDKSSLRFSFFDNGCVALNSTKA